MRIQIPRLPLIGLLAAALLALPTSATPAPIRADDEWSPERVARCTYTRGDAAVRERGSGDWKRLETNAPIFEGDELYAGRAARAEVMLGAGQFARFGDGANVAISRLDDAHTQIAVSSGTLTLSLRRVDDGGRIEIDTPAAALIPRREGVYRVDLSDNGDTWIAIRRGEADIRTPNGSFEADDGDLVSLSVDDSDDFTVGRETVRGFSDSWDRWTDERDAYYANLDRRAYPPEIGPLYGRSDIYGIAELAIHGTWYLLEGHRWAWRPRLALSSGWVPYRDGYWRFSPVAGWVWVSSEPWGWAPYHYGRWDFVPAYGWVWVPHDDYGGIDRWRDRYSWRPALVYLWRPTGADHFAWVPLAPGEPFAWFGRAAPARPRPTVFFPRHLKEKRGMTVIAPAALERREKPRAPTARIKANVDDARQLDTDVRLPKPVRVVPPTKALPTRAKPVEPTKLRPVVVDPQIAPSTVAPKPSFQRPTRKAEVTRIDVTPKVVQERDRARTLDVRPAPGKPRNTKAGVKAGLEKQPDPKVDKPKKRPGEK